MDELFPIKDITSPREEATLRRILRALGKITKGLPEDSSSWKICPAVVKELPISSYAFYCNPPDEVIEELGYDLGFTNQVLRKEFESRSLHHCGVTFNKDGFKLKVVLGWTRELREDGDKDKDKSTKTADLEYTILDELPRCDFCPNKARYDGRTRFGIWAYMCEDHFKQYGIGLGLGKGQMILLPNEKGGRKGKEGGSPIFNISDYGVLEGGVIKIGEVWALPFTKEKVDKLRDLLRDLIKKGDALQRTDRVLNSLYDILGSDKLFDEISSHGSSIRANIARNIIQEYLREVIDQYETNPDLFSKKIEPGVLAELKKFGGSPVNSLLDLIFEMGVIAARDSGISPSSVKEEIASLIEGFNFKSESEVIDRYLSKIEESSFWKEYLKKIINLKNSIMEDFDIYISFDDVIDNFRAGFLSGLEKMGIHLNQIISSFVGGKG